jgi:hypothetical protein
VVQNSLSFAQTIRADFFLDFTTVPRIHLRLKNQRRSERMMLIIIEVISGK